MRFQENCKTADFELCKKEGVQFCRPKIFNWCFLYRLKKIWCEFQHSRKYKIVTIFDLHILQAVALK
jgi:hypothetical protein